MSVCHKPFVLGVFLSFFLFSGPCFSFINIESLRQNLKTGFYGSSGLSVTGSYGNINIFRGSLNSQNIYKKEKHETIFIMDYKYGKASGITNIDRGKAHLRYAGWISQNWHWESFGQIEFNRFQSLALRRLVGFGFRPRLYGNEQISLYMGLGTFYEKEDINGDFDQENLRGNLYFSFRSVQKSQFELVYNFYFQPHYKTFKDYRFLTSLGIEFHFTENLSWVNSLSYSMDTRPPRSVQKEDIYFNVGFNFEY